MHDNKFHESISINMEEQMMFQFQEKKKTDRMMGTKQTFC